MVRSRAPASAQGECAGASTGACVDACAGVSVRLLVFCRWLAGAATLCLAGAGRTHLWECAQPDHFEAGGQQADRALRDVGARLRPRAILAGKVGESGGDNVALAVRVARVHERLLVLADERNVDHRADRNDAAMQSREIMIAWPSLVRCLRKACGAGACGSNAAAKDRQARKAGFRAGGLIELTFRKRTLRLPSPAGRGGPPYLDSQIKAGHFSFF